MSETSTAFLLASQTDLEHHRVRDANDRVDTNRERLVGLDALERQVMRDLMDRQEDVLVRRASYDVRCEQETPIEWMYAPIPHRCSRCELNGYDAEGDPFCEGLAAHQGLDLGVILQNGLTTCTMRLFGEEPEEVILVLLRGEKLRKPGRARCRRRRRSRGRELLC